MSSKWQPIQKSTGLETGPVLTEKQKEAHQSDPQLRGKYTYQEIKQPDPPKEAKKVVKKVKPADLAE